MTDTTTTAPAPKKRSFFKRAAWQDSAKKEGDDIFSHSNEFKDIVAEQTRRQEEERRKEEDKKKRKSAEKSESKRRRMSVEDDSSLLSKSSSSSGARTGRTASKTRSRTPLSPVPTQPNPTSLVAQYDLLTKSTSPREYNRRKESVVIDLGSDSDDCDITGSNTASFGGSNMDTNNLSIGEQQLQDMPVRVPARSTADNSDDEVEEVLDPAVAAIRARARAKAAERARAKESGEKAPIVQLLVAPEIPDAKPLLVKVRVDSTIGKARLAWCGIQNYDKEMTKSVFFTWRSTRIFDSTRIESLGIKKDVHGNISIEGDTNLYDDTNLPKVVVEAWTDQLFQQRKKEDAAEAEARKRAAEISPEAEEREPTPPPVPKVSKVRLFLKARGKEEFKLSVNPDTTFAHIASAYKTSRNIDKQQPITLTFDGDRLMPLDTIADSEIEDMDSLEVHFK